MDGWCTVGRRRGWMWNRKRRGNDHNVCGTFELIRSAMVSEEAQSNYEVPDIDEHSSQDLRRAQPSVTTA